MVISDRIKNEFTNILELVKLETIKNPSVSKYYEYLNNYKGHFISAENVQLRDELIEYLIGANRYADEFLFSSENGKKIRQNINSIYEFLNGLEESPVESERLQFVEQFTTTESYVNELESILENKLPSSYRSFLLTTGGGLVRNGKYYKELDAGLILDFKLSVFFGNCPSKLAFNLRHINVMLIGELPNNLFAIADDGYGNLICIGTSGESKNKIFIAMDNDDEFSNVLLLEDSLEEFISNLGKV